MSALVVFNSFTSNFFQNVTGYLKCYVIDQSGLFYFIYFHFLTWNIPLKDKYVIREVLYIDNQMISCLVFSREWLLYRRCILFLADVQCMERFPYILRIGLLP